MVLMCQRLLPEAERRDIYLQGVSSFTLPKGHFMVRVYCSPHNPGARELAEELNATFSSSSMGVSGRGSRSSRSSRCTSILSPKRISLGILKTPGMSSSQESTSGRFVQIVDELRSSEECDHMLVYLNAATWMHHPEARLRVIFVRRSALACTYKLAANS
eukprot:7208523-Prymnesium_polylepis.2